MSFRAARPTRRAVWRLDGSGVLSRSASSVGIIGRMEQRLSLITLGVSDLVRARAFYKTLGWHTDAAPDDDVAFYQAGGMVVALWGRSALAEDTGAADSGGWGGITLAHNVDSAERVDAVLAEAALAGARVIRPGASTFWGGYAGLFLDPDGHAWEVAHNPFWRIEEDGSTHLAPPSGPPTSVADVQDQGGSKV